MTKLLGTVYRNMHYQLERHNIQKGNTEQACVATSMAVLLGTMRHNEAYKNSSVNIPVKRHKQSMEREDPL